MRREITAFFSMARHACSFSFICTVRRTNVICMQTFVRFFLLSVKLKQTPNPSRLNFMYYIKEPVDRWSRYALMLLLRLFWCRLEIVAVLCTVQYAFVNVVTEV